VALPRSAKPLYEFATYFADVSMVATAIQTVATIIQAMAATVFVIGVWYNYKRRRDERLENIVEKLDRQWELENERTGITREEGHRIYSPRQIDFFNKRLRELGEPWVVSGDFVLKFRRRR
jgi:hypothetical protein